MNDERPIEKLLRRYARKRCDAPDASGLEVHPATRRMLQGEVARRFPRRAAADERNPGALTQILIGWRTRWLWAVPLVIALGIGAWALWGTKDEPGFAFELAQHAPSPAAPVAVASRSFKALESPDAALPIPTLSLTDKSAPAEADHGGVRFAPASPSVPSSTEQKGFAAAFSGAAGHRSETGAVNGFAPTTPAGETRSQVLTARGLAGEVPRSVGDESILTPGLAFSPPARSDSLEDFGRLRRDYVATDERQPARAPTTRAVAAAPDGSGRYFRTEGRGGSVREPEAVYSQAFANQLPGAGAGHRQAAKSAPASASTLTVLANFHVEQTGNQLRVIDSDGSTYLGEVLPPAAQPALGVALEAKGATTLKSEAGAKTDARRFADAAGPAEPDGQTQVAFRVAGTNRTLKQPVVFFGNFVPLTNRLAATQLKTPAGGGNVSLDLLPAQQLPLPLNNAVINGRAQLGGGKEIEINAVPVTR